MTTLLRISQIKRDGGTQTRAHLNEQTIADYADAMADDNCTFPPVTVFYDGADHWLADGFHRVAASLRAGFSDIDADIRQGTRRDAVLFSVGANAQNGLPRSADDKRRAVMTLLNDPEWSQWPQAQIAKACGVSREYVVRLSGSVKPSCDRSQDTTRTVTRGGTTYQQNTANIGRSREPREEPPPAPAPPRPAPPSEPVRSQIANTIPLEGADYATAMHVLSALDRLLAARERWPDPADAMPFLQEFENFHRKLPVVGSWLARLAELEEAASASGHAKETN